MSDNNEDNKKPIILEGEFIILPPMTYHGRIYGKYDWDWDKYQWVLSNEWIEKFGKSK